MTSEDIKHQLITGTFTPSSTAGINPSCGKELNVAGGPAYYR